MSMQPVVHEEAQGEPKHLGPEVLALLQHLDEVSEGGIPFAKIDDTPQSPGFGAYVRLDGRSWLVTLALDEDEEGGGGGMGPWAEAGRLRW